MREQRFTLSRSQREEMWRRFKQTDDRRVAERLHIILLLDAGQNAQRVNLILHLHPNMLKRWIKTFVTSGEEARVTIQQTQMSILSSGDRLRATKGKP